MPTELRDRYTGNLIYSSSAKTVKDALVAAVAAGTDLRNVNLASTDLRGADLRNGLLGGADFTDAKLDGALCDNANLTRCDLVASCIGTSFRGANLQEADVSGANAQNADFTSAIVQSADFAGTILTGDVRDAVAAPDPTITLAGIVEAIQSAAGAPA